jgi:hypothetical protein
MRTLTAFLLFAAVPVAAGRAADTDLVPANLPAEQKANLLKFLKAHEKPDKFVPPGARVVTPAAGPAEPPPEVVVPPNTAIRQYTVQITPHRPVPNRPPPTRVDVYYYRPNPSAAKPGITVKHIVDLATGEQVGDTEVLLNHHTPISRDELGEAVKLAREKAVGVRDLYAGREPTAVRWEYLQLMISKKTDTLEPGDRVVRLVFTAGDGTTPVPVIVDLTKGTVEADSR